MVTKMGKPPKVMKMVEKTASNVSKNISNVFAGEEAGSKLQKVKKTWHQNH